MIAVQKTFAVTILILSALINHTIAQNIVNKKIYISSGFEVRLQFGGEISGTHFNPSGASNSFKTETGKNYINLGSNVKNFDPISLYVDEGTKKHINNHMFILVYKDSMSMAELYYDFSTKEKIEQAMRDAQQEQTIAKQNTLPVQPPTTAPTIIQQQTAQPDNEQQFADLKNKANRAFNEKRYDDASSLYQQALQIKPGDEFCTTQIEAIKNVKAEVIERERHNKEQQAKNESYKNTMDIGKNYLNTHDFDKAATAFQEALKIKPGDAEATRLLNSISVLKNADARQQAETKHNKDLEKQYKDTITYADDAFEAGLLKVARQKYNSVLKINKNDKHALERIEKIDSLENIQRQQKSQHVNDSIANRKYSDTKQKGDDAFAVKDYATAIKYYRLAHTLMPSDTYPDEKIALITQIQNQKVMQAQEEKNQNKRNDSINNQFKIFVNKSDVAYSKKDFNLAFDYIIQALTLKPADEDALKKSTQINNALNTLERDKKYDLFMRIGDSLFYQVKDPDGSLKWYDSAITLKPLEAKPKQQAKLANYQILQRDSVKMVKEKKDALNSSFDEAMTYYRKGNTARTEKKFGEAYEYYTLFLNKIKAYNKSDYSLLQTNYITEVSDYAKKLEPYKITQTTADQVMAQHPDIDFTKAPPEQVYSSQRLDSSKQKAYIINEILPIAPRIKIINSMTDKVRVTCQSMNFKEKYIYLRFVIKNNDASPFLTGPMMLNLVKQNKQQSSLLPLYISEFPIVLPAEERQIIYVIPLMHLWTGETLVFYLSDRLNNNKTSLTINDVNFNMERSHPL